MRSRVLPTAVSFFIFFCVSFIWFPIKMYTLHTTKKKQIFYCVLLLHLNHIIWKLVDIVQHCKQPHITSLTIIFIYLEFQLYLRHIFLFQNRKYQLEPLIFLYENFEDYFKMSFFSIWKRNEFIELSGDYVKIWLVSHFSLWVHLLLLERRYN